MDFAKLFKEEKLRMIAEREPNVNIASTNKPNPKSVSKDNHPTKTSQNINIEVSSEDCFQFPRLVNGLCDVYSVGDIPDLFYIPDVINEQQEASIVTLIHQEGQIDNERWTNLRTRRLQCWGKFPPQAISQRKNESDGLQSTDRERLPRWLDGIINELVNCNIFDDSHRPNNVLINQYKSLEGILHHTDGPSYHDKVAILSLDSDCIMTFRYNLQPSEIGVKFSGDVFSVVLRRRSLLYFGRDVYSAFMHGIATDTDVQVVGSGNDGSPCVCVNKSLACMEDGDKVCCGISASVESHVAAPSWFH